jgi:high affinity sulfate transporter 1
MDPAADRPPEDQASGPSRGPGPSQGAGAIPAPPGHGFQPPERHRSRAHFLPLLEQLRGYRSLRPDLIAGVMVAALALPQAMAYAQIAGLPVVAGLYGLLLPVIAYAFLGSSRVLMTGPTTTAALMVGPALLVVSGDPAAYPALAAMLALLVGLVFLLARLAHLGWLADYFSTAVLLGFVTGLALTMIAGQVGVLLGVGVTGDTPVQQYASFLGGVVGGAHGPTVAIGVTSLVLLVVAGRWFPAFPMLLVLTVGSIILSERLDLAAQGVSVVGDIPAGLPRLSWPAVGLEDVAAMVPAAIGIAVVGFSDSILLARSLARRGEVVDADQELLGLAGMNAAAGLTGSFPVGASGSRTAVNVRLGGRTQVVGLAQAATVVIVLLLLTPALAFMPKAVLAAVIIYAALSLVDVSEWVALARCSRGELLIGGVTVLGMLTVGMLPALLLAVLLSLLDVVRRSAEPRDAVLGWSARHERFVDVEPRRDALLVPGVVVYRLDDRLFFANARYFAARVEQAVNGSPTPVTVFVFDAEAVSHLDATSAATIEAVIDTLEAQGITFVVARARAVVREQLERFGLDRRIPPDRRFPTVRAAVEATTGHDVSEWAVDPPTS